MIAVVAACREETGRELHCRIGVSAGEVLAGVLGRLQPRFHIFGAGLSAAEQHEKAGQIDAVHASPTFMAALALAGNLRRGSGESEEGCGTKDGGKYDVRSGRQLLAAAEAQECVRTGSSGSWDLERSDMVELPVTSQAAVFGESSFTSSAAEDPALKNLSPESGAPSISLPCCQAEADHQQYSFILRPHVADDHDSILAEPGRRFFAATSASLSHLNRLPVQPLPRRMSFPMLPGLPLSRRLGRNHSIGSDSRQQGQQDPLFWLGNGSAACGSTPDTVRGVYRGPSQELAPEVQLVIAM